MDKEEKPRLFRLGSKYPRAAQNEKGLPEVARAMAAVNDGFVKKSCTIKRNPDRPSIENW